MNVDLLPTWTQVRDRGVRSCWLEPTDGMERELEDTIEAWRFDIRVHPDFREGAGKEYEILVYEVFLHEDGRTEDARTPEERTVALSLSEAEDWVESQVEELSATAMFRDCPVADSANTRR